MLDGTELLMFFRFAHMLDFIVVLGHMIAV